MKSVSNNEHGIALLLVLWVITLFAIICTEFSWTMRTESIIARNFRDGEQAYYAAESGIHRAIIEMERSSKLRKSSAAPEDAEETEDLYWEPGAPPYRFSFDGGDCEVRIEDEGNKIGLHAYLKKAKSNPTLLKSLIENKIGLEGEDRDILADSLIDWYDKDSNITGVHGAENDYYQSLDPPYSCRNGYISVIEELLLVRGVTEKAYYGASAMRPNTKVLLTEAELAAMTAEHADDFPGQENMETEAYSEDGDQTNLGLCNIFSTFSLSTSFRPNINTASFEQLLLLEGMTPETAREIIAERKIRLFQSKTDRLPQFENYGAWQNSIQVKGTGTTKYYKIIATGFSRDRQISKTISCNYAADKKNVVITNWKILN